MHIAIKLVQSPELSQFPVSVLRLHRLGGVHFLNSKLQRWRIAAT